MTGWLITLFGLLFLGFVIYQANQKQKAGQGVAQVTTLLLPVIIFNLLTGISVLLTPSMPAEAGSLTLDWSTALQVFGISATSSAAALGLLVSLRVRHVVGRLCGPSSSYSPENPVHITALILSLCLVSTNLALFLAAGGISGLAESLALEGLALGDLFFQQVLWLLTAMLGVGFAIRRDSHDSLQRLGLRIPTMADVGAGVGIAFLGILLIIVFSLVVSFFLTPEQITAQGAASEQIALAFDSLGVVLIAALAIAIGEEVFFRGALQPVFGIGLTSIFFTIVHTQYAFTPTTVVILLVSLAFGWLRQRYSTTSAIIAHFLYNFVQLALAVAARSVISGG